MSILRLFIALGQQPFLQREFQASQVGAPREQPRRVLRSNTIFGPIHDAKITLNNGRYGIEVQIDSVSGDGTKARVVINRGGDRYVTEVSAGCKQSMYPETIAPQSESSSTQHLVADVAFATRSKARAPPERIAEQHSLPVKLPPSQLTGKVKSSVQDQWIQYPLSNLAVRSSIFEQTKSPKLQKSLRNMPLRHAPSSLSVLHEHVANKRPGNNASKKPKLNIQQRTTSAHLFFSSESTSPPPCHRKSCLH